MSNPFLYTHLGWLVSPYSAKTRACFRFKRVPVDDREPALPEMLWTVRRAVGRVVMPTVRTPQGEWVQDSSDICDLLEARFPTPAIVPAGPAQRAASYLLELYGDEWLVIMALAFRWLVPQNAAFAWGEFGRAAAPLLPAFVQRRLGERLSRPMRAYLLRFGITPDTWPGIEHTFEALLDALDAHLARHSYLLGERPCHGDFSIFGMLWAHPFRDCGTTHRFDRVRHVRAWFERLNAPPSTTGEFLAADGVPETLDPVLRLLFTEAMPYFLEVVRRVDAWVEAHPQARRVPRSLGATAFQIGGVDSERPTTLSYSQWMLQRPLDVWSAADAAGRARIEAFLQRAAGSAAVTAIQTPIRHRLVRHNYREWIAGRVG